MEGAMVAIIEMNDCTHDGEKDVKRDTLLTSAGYCTVRWQPKTKPETATISAELRPHP